MQSAICILIPIGAPRFEGQLQLVDSKGHCCHSIGGPRSEGQLQLGGGWRCDVNTIGGPRFEGQLKLGASRCPKRECLGDPLFEGQLQLAGWFVISPCAIDGSDLEPAKNVQDDNRTVLPIDNPPIEGSAIIQP